MSRKVRLDLLLTRQGSAPSRSKAQALIMAGQVKVNGQVVSKAGTAIAKTAQIEVDQGVPYVSRGGEKLAAALEHFMVQPQNAVCADVGASTGGFTDALLQAGAARVYAIDVGYGQLAWKLRQDSRVTVMERTNARYLEQLPEPIDLATIDASFISLRLLLPAVVTWLATPAAIIALVKPQFEAGRAQVGKGGVVRQARVHEEVLEKIIAFAAKLDLTLLGLIASPLTGPAGNHEFLLHLGWQTERPPVAAPSAIAACLARLHTD